MSLNDSSAVILIVGALVVFGFVIHGLMSGRSINRKLVKGNKEDQEIVKSEGVGKVRIVTAKEPSPNSDLKLETYGQMPKAKSEDNQAASSSSEAKASSEVNIQTVSEPKAFVVKANSSLEINLVCDPERPYRGLDLQELSNKYGFLRGAHNILCVYENPNAEKPIVVFRICSLEPPYNFPVDMTDYKTSELALYMNVPVRGKALAYFKAMRMAALIIQSQLGGTLRDNYEKPLSEDELNALEQELQSYDESEI
jgi:FtsZ-interacting cell division protein ZipA